VGSALASRLKLSIGSVLPPFYRNEKGELLSQVVGIFRRDAPHWQANLILTTFDSAQAIFDQTEFATDVLVWCRPDARDAAVRAIEQESLPSPIHNTLKTRLHVTAREDLQALTSRELLHREGVMHAIFLVAVVVGMLVLVVTSGAGLSERRREIGILKAIGWHTDQVLLRGFVESLALAIIGSGIAIVGAWVWLRVLNGYGIAGLLLPGAGAAPAFRVPFDLAPTPVFVAAAVSLVMVLTGTLYSIWRAAIAPPAEAMR
jgi:ABC-type lipoprotein release transport system permease subunit